LGAFGSRMTVIWFRFSFGYEHLWRLLALQNVFLHEKSVTLSGLLVFTSILWGSFNGVATGKRSRPFWSFQQVENSSAGFFLPARRTVRAVKILA